VDNPDQQSQIRERKILLRGPKEKERNIQVGVEMPLANACTLAWTYAHSTLKNSPRGCRGRAPSISI